MTTLPTRNPGARADEPPLTFGPVPSRRLGRSLGINHIPPKSCSYACIYCQVGPTAMTEVQPRAFRDPREIVACVSRRVRDLFAQSESIDALTFVPDGEPTLDARLGETIEGLRPLGLRIAVISNGSLLWRPEVRAALARADWVSLKVDAVDEITWRRMQRPHGSLRLDAVLEGMECFARGFDGELATETMLVRGLNDTEGHVDAVATFVERLEPAVAYLAIPTRPPVERWVRPADESLVVRAYARFSEHLPCVELLTEAEEDTFAVTGDPQRDLLAITAVHPMRDDAVRELLKRDGVDASVLRRLLASGRLRRVRYRGTTFYARNVTRPPGEESVVP